MTYLLKFRYDDRDFLEMWLPEFDSEFDFDLESGLYEYANTARRKGSNRAFDSIMIDAFSKAYPEVIDEVKRKEPPVEKENYDVPSLNLYQVRLSEILENIYRNLVCPQKLRQPEEALAY
ncbi:MAG: hypothetical protein ONB44_24875 [candidate division KSB1 bacterium]|nr:hypothetical protein [candidate division KSB1 bacterium]MDZ7305368.1 hypothetical protein [candidate division KSB1 bacterium]MDZ7314454.1 hypothetical protein [candidate division KSB1 bacterium]